MTLENIKAIKLAKAQKALANSLKNKDRIINELVRLDNINSQESSDLIKCKEESLNMVIDHIETCLNRVRWSS
jgi:hypothetical protein